MNEFSDSFTEMHAGAADFERTQELFAATRAFDASEAMAEARGNSGVPVFASGDGWEMMPGVRFPQ